MTYSETGTLFDRFPYVRAGAGPRTLVVFPGLGDAMFGGAYPPGAGWAFGWYVSRFVGEYTVYALSRPRGLPPDHSIADMADDYVKAVETELGSADVLGVSMGGMIGLELSVRHPELVDRLALANSGCRLVDVDAVERFLRYAGDRDWARIRAELCAAMFTDWRAVSYPPIALTAGRLVQPRPAVPADVSVSLRAIRDFDASDHLGDVAARTFVFGGTDDPYFPERILEETADGIPDAELALVRNGKHAAFHERKSHFDSRLRAFLLGQANTGD